MTLRLATSAQRRILLAAAFVFAGFLSYSSLRNAMAIHYAGLQTPDGYRRAISLEPADSRNWYLLGRYWQYNLEDPDASRAIQSYLSALSLNPGSAEIWSDLATAYESEGNLAAARDAFVRARRAYPLSAEVSWRYGNFLLRQGELESAFAEMRRAVAAEPKRGAEALSRALRAQPDIDLVLDRVLPPVAEAYIHAIGDQTADGHIDNALKIWDRLDSIHPRLPLQDSFPLVNALLQRNRIAEAHRTWDQAVIIAGLVDLPEPPDSVLWDGGFESGILGGGFAWLTPVGIRGVQIDIDPQEKHSGNHSLRLMFDGKSNLNFNGVCHYVPVQPSTRYRFSAWVRTRALTTDQGIRFQLHSIGTQDSPITMTPDVHGTEGWTRIEAPWSSSNAQELQVCLVRLPSDQAENNRIQGMAWVDDVALVPEPAERPKP
jgi:tetratricopeptide (TPR) repeat protein